MNIKFTSVPSTPIPQIPHHSLVVPTTPFPWPKTFMWPLLLIHIVKTFKFIVVLHDDALGAIFSEEQKDTSIELAFKYAVYKINKDRSILPKTTLVYDIQYVPDSTDSFRTSKKVCKQIENGVTAIFGKGWTQFLFTMSYNSMLKVHLLSHSRFLLFFDFIKKGPPSDPLLSPHIQSICEALDIPHLETRFDIDTGAKEFSINLYPQQKKLNDAILETVKYLNWTRYAIIYEGNKLDAIGPN